MSKSSIGLSQPAYEHILKMIMTRELLPGDRIPESKIAQEFNISRTPVRDAMRQLANEGLLEIYPNRFAEVKVYTPEEITEIGTLRISLDSMSVRLASLFGSRSDFLRLENIAKQCEEAAEKKDSVLRRQLDCDFHMALTELSGNSLLIKYQKEIYLRVQYIMTCRTEYDDFEIKSLAQHMEIIQALMDNDVDKAAAVNMDHLMAYYDLKDTFPPNFFK